MILTRKELAKKLQVTTAAVVIWEKKGLPVLRPAGGDPRYEWDDVKKWLEKKEVKQ